MVKQGDVPKLENLNVISFQFFDTFPKSANYLHKVQLKDQEQQVYFDRQTVTVIEVKISNFSSRFLMNISLNEFDEGLAKYEMALEIAKNLCDQGKLSLEEISAVTKLTEDEIRELKWVFI